MTNSYDLAVVGSGFAGSLIAMIARRLGRSVVMIDKGKHPRTVIGESSTPLTNLLLEELCDRYDLPQLRPLTKWGTWQRTYPKIAVGLKRGFTFYHHDLNHPAHQPPDRTNQLLVAASPRNEVADTHWYRADFDHFLVQQAQQLGADYFDETSLTTLTQDAAGATLEGSRHQQPFSISAKFLIDATGPRGFLHRAFNLEEIDLPGLPKTQAIYNHFTGVRSLEETSFGKNREQPPYPIDDAAVHHIFDGGWVWILRFNNDITSAGIAATREAAPRLNFPDGEAAWRRLLQQIPALQQQFAQAQLTQPFTHIPHLSFRSATIVGDRWAMLPSAAGFVDPLLSTGFPLTLLGIARLAEILEQAWDSPQLPHRLKDYASHTDADLLAAAQLIAALYAKMNNFPVFTAISLLYFAAVSYAETARRLGKPQLASDFLLRSHLVFGTAAREILQRAQQAGSSSEQLIADIHQAIEPINIADLGNPARRNWYPVDLQDLFGNAAKVRATPDEITRMLHRCGLSPSPDQIESDPPELISKS